MIEIKYHENNFEILFPLKEYIPESYFTDYDDAAELNFYVDIFKNEGIYDGGEGSLIEYPTSEIQLLCKFGDVPFSMWWDDWGFVSFSVAKEYENRKNELAEYLCELINKAKAD